jgi:hypothetical protein
VAALVDVTFHHGHAETVQLLVEMGLVPDLQAALTQAVAVCELGKQCSRCACVCTACCFVAYDTSRAAMLFACKHGMPCRSAIVCMAVCRAMPCPTRLMRAYASLVNVCTCMVLQGLNIETARCAIAAGASCGAPGTNHVQTAVSVAAQSLKQQVSLLSVGIMDAQPMRILRVLRCSVLPSLHTDSQLATSQPNVRPLRAAYAARA